MKRVALLTVLSLALASSAMAQGLSTSPASLSVNFAPKAAQNDPARRGFTALANIGFGVQSDEFYEQTVGGLAGLNFGAGWFVSNNLAILGRYSTTTGTFDSEGPIRQMSGVFGATAQYWLNRRFAVEGGVGMGYWSDDADQSETGFGVIAGFVASLYNKGPHHVTAGFEYAPAFTNTGTVHNMGFVVGYQLILVR